MKIKVNQEKQTVSLKGLTPVQFALIEQLLAHVRLGDGTYASEAAFEILTAIEECDELGGIEKSISTLVQQLMVRSKVSICGWIVQL